MQGSTVTTTVTFDIFSKNPALTIVSTQFISACLVAFFVSFTVLRPEALMLL